MYNWLILVTFEKCPSDFKLGRNLKSVKDVETLYKVLLQHTLKLPPTEPSSVVFFKKELKMLLAGNFFGLHVFSILL